MNKPVENFRLGIRTNGEIRDALSWSGYNLWKSSKEAYRDRYYENGKPIETVETIFGKRFAELKEEDVMVIGSETSIEVRLPCGLSLVSFLDSFDKETFAIEEYKTGHKNKEGKSPWTKLKVAKHKQLDFYSLMVKKKFGKVQNKVKLIWYETRFKTKEIEFEGHILTSDSRELELTGYEESFTRTIVQWERDKMEKDIINVAREITQDFIQYEKNTPRSQ